MPAEVLARVFEPFFTTKDIGKGSGLGLAQVYGFVGQSGGRVDIDSTPGVGTTVTLTFPRSAKQIEAADVHAAPAPRPAAAERGHVLLVEDDAEVAALVRDMLISLGFAVTHVKSAEAALGALKDGRNVDIVLSDVMMAGGGMSGVELAREIRRRHAELPVVLTTGYIEAAREAEADGVPVLVKPYQIEALAELIDLRFRRRDG
jgi:CheY-like chemotaxis protein